MDTREQLSATDELAGAPGMRRVLAEMVGTFALTLVAAGADTAARVSGGEVDIAARAVAPALLVVGFIYALGDASGAHFNPVVSLAFSLKGLFPGRWVPVYWAAQVAGAVLAAMALRAPFGDDAAAGVSTPHVAAGTAVIIEAGLTWLLLMVILGTADRYRVVGQNAALAVGGAIALCGLIAIPLSGASMNPARSLGPALANMRLGDMWIYLVGPLIGASLAVFVTRALHGRTETDPQAVKAAEGGTEAGSESEPCPTQRPGLDRTAMTTRRAKSPL